MMGRKGIRNGGNDMMKMNTGARIDRRCHMLLACMLLIASAIVLSWPCTARGSDAKSILKAMSDYVNSQKTIEVTFDSDIEIITPELEKIQFTNSGDILLSRPNRLRAHRVGGYAGVARRSTVGAGAPGVGVAPGVGTGAPWRRLTWADP